MNKTKSLIDDLIQQKARGNTFQELNIQMKLLLKGIDCKKIDENTPDDPEMIQKIVEVAQSFNVKLSV